MPQALSRLFDRALHPILRRVSNSQRAAQHEVARQMERNAFLFADILLQQLRSHPRAGLRDWEFGVCSQWGQDGILQYLIARVPIENRTFVEFGVQDYQESTTRFLMMHDNWSGLIMDGDPANRTFIEEQEYFWRYDLSAVCAFITRDNINELIGARFSGDVGVLVIDIDGNDYWVWDALEVISPRIVVCEYNSVFGPDHAITVPYQADFVRTRAHHSNLYFGASLAALCQLATRKGYTFVGCNSHGNDAFFVRNDVAQNVTPVTAREGYVYSRFREARDSAGKLTHMNGHDRLKIIAGLSVFDLSENRTRLLREFDGAPVSDSSSRTPQPAA